ncbi:MAG: elongation factor 4 [Candidatus Liptonbacteria bacterium]|nr:elongation factor 4 [Candidatus Liptonbacteria bacterium]
MIRNFVITAHIDHGKSTLADRMLELTGTVEKRKMRAQYLDKLDLERERGITIKMAPDRMLWQPNRGSANQVEYILNLIDTPGHSDFSYEVSRSLAAVEGAVLLVDATQGIQAQTIANFHAARNAGLAIIGAINKIDLNPPHMERCIADLAKLIGADENDILRVSGKTGEGVTDLLEAIVRRVPPPRSGMSGSQALIFDSFYDEHKGVIAYVRVFGGMLAVNAQAHLAVANADFMIREVGAFVPELRPIPSLEDGMIGWVATGVKDTELIRIGDTIGTTALPGYREPQAVVFVSLYPDPSSPSADAEYEDLKMALRRLKLNDYALKFEADASPVLGRGFKCGFLGRLHFEIAVQRLEREFNLTVVTSFPSVAYRVRTGGEWTVIKNPNEFPDAPEEVLQPTARLNMLVPPAYMNAVLNLKDQFHLSAIETELFGDRMMITATIPVSDLIRDFDDKMKSVSNGHASFTYEIGAEQSGDVEKIEILAAGEVVPGLTRILAADEAEREGRSMIVKLKELLPRQQFAQALQARMRGRIIARETIPALKKDVTGYLYGGDRSRKMKLWKKQQRGKKRLGERAHVSVPPEVFRELMKK